MNEQSVSVRKSYLLVLPLIMMVLLACSFSSFESNRTTIQGSGKKASESRQVSDIQRVSLRGSGELTIIQGNQEGLTIEADDNILPHLKAEKRGRELILQPEKGVSLSPRTPIRYTLMVKEINRASVSGSASIIADSIKAQDFSSAILGSGSITYGKLDVQDVAFDISGSGKIIVGDLKGQTVEAKISGSGEYDLTGEVDKETIVITGAGYYQGAGLKCSDASGLIFGSGDVTVRSASKLNITMIGSGKVSYYGDPRVSKIIVGGGNIQSLFEHESKQN